MVENCVLAGVENINDAGTFATAKTAAAFKITDGKLYVPIVTLFAEDNAKLSNKLNKEFQGSVYWNKHNVVSERNYNANAVIIDCGCHRINKLFVFAYAQNVAVSSHQKCFPPRVEIENYYTEIDWIRFYDKSINNQEKNSLIKQYDKIRKTSIGQADDYTTDCLLNFAHFKNN